MDTLDQEQTVSAAADPAVDSQPLSLAAEETVSVLGVEVTDVSRHRAVELLREMIDARDGRTRDVYFVNTHTLNLSAGDSTYREVLNAADCVFGDGTGVRWGARLKGVRLKDNLCGTDLVPMLLKQTATDRYRYFLLGGNEETSYKAAQYAAATFNDWTQVGHHHGYVQDETKAHKVIQMINDAQPHVLLVGMGNPLQEQWIHKYRAELRVPLCIGVGGLFAYWAGTLQRAPKWLRHVGYEWLGILLQQPKKAKRYLLGNPLFLWRIAIDACKHHGKS